MTLLSVVNAAQLKCGLTPSTSAFTNTDPDTQQFVRFAYEIGKDLILRWTWLTGKMPGTFSGTGNQTLFDLPADFQTLSPSDTFVSSAFPTMVMRGPVNEDELLRLKALPVVVYPSCWRRIGKQIEFYPALQASEVVTYNYASKYWIKSAAGVPQATWAADTDLSNLDEDLLIEGATWKWKRAKGLDYAEEFNTYERMLNSIASQENTERTISMSTLTTRDPLQSAYLLNSVSGAMLLLAATSLPLLLQTGETIDLIGNI